MGCTIPVDMFVKFLVVKLSCVSVWYEKQMQNGNVVIHECYFIFTFWYQLKGNYRWMLTSNLENRIVN